MAEDTPTEAEVAAAREIIERAEEAERVKRDAASEALRELTRSESWSTVYAGVLAAQTSSPADTEISYLIGMMDRVSRRFP